MAEKFINNMLDINKDVIRFFIRKLLLDFYNKFNRYINDNDDSDIKEKEKEINDLLLKINNDSFDFFNYIKEKKIHSDIIDFNDNDLQIFNKNLLNFDDIGNIKNDSNYRPFNENFTDKYIKNCIINNIFLCSSLGQCQEYNNLYQQLLFLYKNQNEDAGSEDAGSEDAEDNNLKKELFLNFLEKSYIYNKKTFDRKIPLDIKAWNIFWRVLQRLY